MGGAKGAVPFTKPPNINTPVDAGNALTFEDIRNTRDVLDDNRRCNKWYLVDSNGEEHLAVVGEERETRDGHYTYKAEEPFYSLHPLICGNQTQVFNWLDAVQKNVKIVDGKLIGSVTGYTTPTGADAALRRTRGASFADFISSKDVKKSKPPLSGSKHRLGGAAEASHLKKMRRLQQEQQEQATAAQNVLYKKLSGASAVEAARREAARSRLLQWLRDKLTDHEEALVTGWHEQLKELWKPGPKQQGPVKLGKPWGFGDRRERGHPGAGAEIVLQTGELKVEQTGKGVRAGADTGERDGGMVKVSGKVAREGDIKKEGDHKRDRGDVEGVANGVGKGQDRLDEDRKDVNGCNGADKDAIMTDADGGNKQATKATVAVSGRAEAMETDEQVEGSSNPPVQHPHGNGTHKEALPNGHADSTGPCAAVSDTVTGAGNEAKNDGHGEQPLGEDDKPGSAHVILHTAAKSDASAGEGFKLVDYSDDEDDSDVLEDDNGEAPSFPRRCVRPRSSPMGMRGRKTPVGATTTATPATANPSKLSQAAPPAATKPMIPPHTSTLLSYNPSGRISLTPPPPPPTSQLNKLAFSFPTQHSLSPSSLSVSAKPPQAGPSAALSPNSTTSPPSPRHTTKSPGDSIPAALSPSSTAVSNPHAQTSHKTTSPAQPASSTRSAAAVAASMQSPTTSRTLHSPTAAHAAGKPPADDASAPNSVLPSPAIPSLQDTLAIQSEHPPLHTQPAALDAAQKLQQFQLQHLLLAGLEEQKQHHLQQSAAKTSLPLQATLPSPELIALQLKTLPSPELIAQQLKALSQRAHNAGGNGEALHTASLPANSTQLQLEKFRMQQALLHTLQEQRQLQMDQAACGCCCDAAAAERQKPFAAVLEAGAAPAVHQGRAEAATEPPQDDVREILGCLRELKGMYLPLQYMHQSGVVQTVLTYQHHPHPVVCWLAKQVVAQWTWMVSTRIHLMASKELMEDPVAALQTAMGSPDSPAPAAPAAVPLDAEPCNSSERTPRAAGLVVPTTTNSDSGGRVGRRGARKKAGAKSNLSKSYASKSNVSRSSQGGGRQLSYTAPGGTCQSGSMCSDAEEEVQGTATKVKDEIKLEPEEPSPQPHAPAGASDPIPIEIPDPHKETTPPPQDPTVDHDPAPHVDTAATCTASTPSMLQSPTGTQACSLPATVPDVTPPTAPTQPPSATLPTPTADPAALACDTQPVKSAAADAVDPPAAVTRVTAMEIGDEPSGAPPSDPHEHVEPKKAAAAAVDNDNEEEEEEQEEEDEEEEEEEEEKNTTQANNHMSTGGKKKPPGIAGKTRPGAKGLSAGEEVADDDEDEDEDDSDAGSDSERPTARKSLDGKTLPRGREGEKTIPRWNPGGDDDDEEEDEEEEEE